MKRLIFGKIFDSPMGTRHWLKANSDGWNYERKAKKIFASRFTLHSSPVKAFTLAEVLITLGIIGVVASLTVPTLMQNANERATVTALKKAYSTLSNAYKLAEQEDGTPDNWGLVANPSPQLLNKLVPYLKVDKDCTDNSLGCFPAGVTYKWLAASLGNYTIFDNLAYPKLKLTDGTLIFGSVDSPSCIGSYGNSLALQNECAHYWVDINGYKNPNQMGKDVFGFWLTKYGIVPIGSAQETLWPFANYCKDKDNQNGYSCAAWVLYNDNMDYLHCNDLDWTTKTKCN